MRYYLSWSEKQVDFNNGRKSRDLIKVLLEVYGVSDFVIYSKKFCIVGSNWIEKKSCKEGQSHFDYDTDFYFMLRAFLPERKVIKFTKLLTVQRKDFFNFQIKQTKKYDDKRLSMTREDKSYNEKLKEVFNA